MWEDETRATVTTLSRDHSMNQKPMTNLYLTPQNLKVYVFKVQTTAHMTY